MVDESAKLDLHNFLRTRRSVRHFKPQALSDSVVTRLVETATCAPSAHNLQPWRFVVLRTEDAKKRLGKALTDSMQNDMRASGAADDEIEARVTRSLRRLNQAPLVILLCCDTEAVHQDEPEEHTMATQSVAAAGLQLILAAHADGLGSNWICWPLYAPDAARTALALPPSWTPQAMFFIGYADEEPKAKELKSLEEICRFM